MKLLYKIEFSKENTYIIIYYNMSKNDSNIEHTLMFDGGSRGNPGICGSGFVLYKNNEIIAEESSLVSDNNTNNFAEYMALILGLTKAKILNIKYLNVKGDSQLVINQVTGKYKVNSENLKPLHKKAVELINAFDVVLFEHIKRNLNKFADKLANNAMDTYTPITI
jgi:ribonuclease HI